MIKQFDRTNIRVLRSEIDQALAFIASKHNIEVRTGAGRFSSTNLTLKLELSAKSADGKVVTKEAATFTELAELFGMKAEWLGKTFQRFGKTYTVTGLNTKLRSHGVSTPVLAATGGREWKISVEDVIRGFNPTKLDKDLDAAGKHADAVDASIVIGSRNPNHDAIEAEIAELRADCPEGYYADGEHRAAGLGEKQIHDLHYRQIARKYLPGYKPLFGGK
jgi:hypothetical protein